jgi:predicted DNA-binding transcriptional regulator AlpA
MTEDDIQLLGSVARRLRKMAARVNQSDYVVLPGTLNTYAKKLEGIRERQRADALLNYTEASVVLGVTPTMLRSWVKRRVVPHIRLAPKIVRFKESELATFLDSKKVEPRT